MLVTVQDSIFSISFHENAEQEILDNLEKDCQPASLEERVAFCDRISLPHCPHIDRNKESLLRHLGR